MHKHTALLALASLVGLFAACSSDGTPSEDLQSVQLQPLTVTAGDVTYCASGTININGPTTTSISTVCGSNPDPVFLRAGHYTGTISPLSCTGSGIPAGAERLSGCTAEPFAFDVKEGEDTTIPIEVEYDYEGLEPFSILYGAGAAKFTLATPTTKTTLNLCGITGHYVTCTSGRSCATFDGVGPACYADCTSSHSSCGEDVCVPVIGTGVTGGPTIMPEGSQNPAGLDALYHVCVPAAESGLGGAGGSTGTGGAPSTGGTSETGGSS